MLKIIKNREYKILKRLYEIDNGDYDRYQGICHNVDRAVDFYTTDILKKYFVRWPKYSGHLYFPVPVPKIYKHYGPLTTYCYVSNKWSGEYGELRKELLKFIINELERELYIK
jgi:hypothetical protein